MRSAWPSARVRQASTRRPYAVLHQRVAEKGELGLHARALAIEPGLGIGRRGVGVVAARSALYSRLVVTPTANPAVTDRRCHPSAESSSGTPTPESACRRPRNVPCDSRPRQSAAHDLGKKLPPPDAPASDRDSSRRSSDPRSDHRAPRRQTSETAGCNATARTVAARCGSNRTLAAASPGSVSPARSSDGRPPNKAPRTRSPAPTKLRLRSPGLIAADDPR